MCFINASLPSRQAQPSLADPAHILIGAASGQLAPWDVPKHLSKCLKGEIALVGCKLASQGAGTLERNQPSSESMWWARDVSGPGKKATTCLGPTAGNFTAL